MKPELQKQLIEKYPKIFNGVNKPITESCMPFGFECGDGWYFLLDILCSQLQWDIDRNKYPQIEASQVKEKFGTLRYYFDYINTPFRHKFFVWKGWKYFLSKYYYNLKLGHSGKISLGGFDLQFVDTDSIRKTAAQEGMVSLAEFLSGFTCEDCGVINKTVTQSEGGWIYTKCPKCKNKKVEKSGNS